VAWEFLVLTAAQPVSEGHRRLFVGGRKWDEAHDRFRNVRIIAAIALLIRLQLL
jgi:hypothetical protein